MEMAGYHNHKLTLYIHTHIKCHLQDNIQRNYVSYSVMIRKLCILIQSYCSHMRVLFHTNLTTDKLNLMWDFKKKVKHLAVRCGEVSRMSGRGVRFGSYDTHSDDIHHLITECDLVCNWWCDVCA